MKKNLVSLFIIVSAFLSVVCLGQTNTALIDSIRKSNNIPELSYAVITDQNTLEIASLGHHSVNLKDTASLNDRFHLGSNTKAMTAFIIAKYVEKGKLKWQTKFFDIFPEWKNQSRPEYANITLQDLLSHRALIQPFQGGNDPDIPKFEGDRQHKRALFGKFVLTLEPVINDSTHQFTYSNAGYTLATLMLERSTKLSWEQLVDTRDGTSSK